MTPTEIRLQLLRNGYPPLPLNGKAPTPKGWQEKLDTGAEEINQWATTWPNATNTGVLCRLTPFLDIDILSPDAAKAVEDLVRGRFEDEADIVVRIGKPPKRAIPFRTDTPFAKITVSLVAPNHDTSQKVEFLCDGQQCVVDGIHPDTNKPYTWFGKSLTNTAREQLPCISADQAQQLIDDIVGLLVHDHGYSVSSKHQKFNGGAGEGHAELVRQVLTGENYHAALTSLAWRFVGANMPGGQVVEYLRGTMLTVPDAQRDERWQARFDEIPRLVSTAEAKRTAAQKPKPNLDIDGAALLDQVHTFLGRFVAYPSEHAQDAHTLWIAHTHAMDAWESTPRLAFLSPEPASGKTRALEASEPLVPRPVEAVNVSPAYLFRKVADDDGRPTILFDEIDTVFGPKAKENEELRGLLNAGHRKGAVAGRCVARGNPVQTEEIPAYSAVALAGLGGLPDTILSRSVIIRMRRRAPDEKVEPWRAKIERRRKQLEESVSRYLSQLDTADRQDPSETLTLKKVRIKEKLEKLQSEMAKLAAIEKQVLLHRISRFH